MMKSKRLKWTCLLVLMLLFAMTFMTIRTCAAGQTYQLGGDGWSMRLDTPGMDSKPYWHVHFYQKGAQKYCLRLDNLKPCDGYKSNPVPNSILKKARNTLGDKWGYGISKETINWGKNLLIAGAVLAVVVATICPFDGVAGDVAAWGLLLGAL